MQILAKVWNILKSRGFFLPKAVFLQQSTSTSINIEVFLPKAVSSNYILFSMLNLLLKFIFKGLLNIRLKLIINAWFEDVYRKSSSYHWDIALIVTWKVMYLKTIIHFENFYIKFTSNEIFFLKTLSKALWIVSIHANIGTKCISMLKFIVREISFTLC